MANSNKEKISWEEWKKRAERYEDYVEDAGFGIEAAFGKDHPYIKKRREKAMKKHRKEWEEYSRRYDERKRNEERKNKMITWEEWKKRAEGYEDYIEDAGFGIEAAFGKGNPYIKERREKAMKKHYNIILKIIGLGIKKEKS